MGWHRCPRTRFRQQPFRVLTDGGRTTAVGTRVAAGQLERYRRGARPDPVHGFDAPAAVAWRRGAIVIRDRPFAEALTEIGRYRAGRIVLLRDASRYGQVTARLALADLDGGIDALAVTRGLSVTRVTGYMLIVR